MRCAAAAASADGFRWCVGSGWSGGGSDGETRAGGDGEGEEVIDGMIDFGVWLADDLKVFHDVNGTVFTAQS